jgi:hypothetical protein
MKIASLIGSPIPISSLKTFHLSLTIQKLLSFLPAFKLNGLLFRRYSTVVNLLSSRKMGSLSKKLNVC